ncbi:MAG: nucleoside deaminase [Leptospirales bacterium]
MTSELTTIEKSFEKAYEYALISLQMDEVPAGAVIIRKGEIISGSGNKIKTNKNPTAHAELIAIQQATQTLQNERLTGCELVCTLEPCAMCSGAIILARIEKVHFLAYDEKLPALRQIVELPGHNHKVKWQRHEIPHLPYIETLQKFFREKRKSKSS